MASITGVAGTARGGETTPISWQITNTGDRDTIATGWTDRVYLSSDALLDASDELLAAIDHVGALAQGADYAVTTDVELPVGIEGDVYLLVTTDESYYTLLIGIKRMLDVGEGQAEWQIIMASTMLAMLPPVLVVIFMQKQFVRGMTETEK